MEFDVLTLFPQMFASVLGESIFHRALDKKLLTIHFHQIRDYASDKHHTVDDHPYGGGAGMVMRCEPLYGAWKAAKERNPNIPAHTIYLSPQGIPLTQQRLANIAAKRQAERIILVCGRYEGIDERFLELCVDEQISLGDFVVSGGELPAMAFMDGVMRLLPEALGNAESSNSESFSEGLLEYPQYTRPPEFMGHKVPDALLSGNHSLIRSWRQKKSLERTQERRPELLKNKS